MRVRGYNTKQLNPKGVMMSDPVTKTDLIEQLRDVQHGVSATVQALPEALFYQGTAESWSACDYLKHLILSVKPFARGLNLPREELEKRFGLATRPSKSYAELTVQYQEGLNSGVKAENYPIVLPSSYRFPEGVEIADVKQHLAQTWEDANNRLVAGLEHWDEQGLDSYQLPHAALGTITLREMLFFTLHHNTLHWRDIQSASQASA
jgi:hypothetical protein